MKRKSLYALVFAIALSTLALAIADAWSIQSPTQATISGPGMRGIVNITDKDENFVVRANDNTFAYYGTAMQPRFVLPGGLMSADGEKYYAAFPYADMTSVHRFNLRDGSIEKTFAIDGAWNLSRVSANGKWLVFARTVQENKTRLNASSKSEFAIVNAESGQVTRMLSFDGNFEADAISAVGDAFFLIEYLPDHYQVRLYDVSTGKLLEGAVVDKREADEEMVGFAWDAVAATHGDWLLTLYLNTEEKHAFIHALNLHDKYPWCIDLPGNKSDEAALKQYALALSPDQQTLYAVNPALGTLAIVDYQNASVTRTIPFPAVQAEPNATTRAVASTDGKFVYFTNGKILWQFDVNSGQIQQVNASRKPVVALTVREGDRALYVMYADHSMEKVDAQAVLKNASAFEKCPVTHSPTNAFTPPAPFSKTPPSAQEFWWGGEKLWSVLPASGKWSALPQDANGYTQKIPWWRKDYDWQQEPTPALTVTGKRLDGNAPPLIASRATNGYEATYKSFMLAGVEIPTGGCWQITGQYGDEELSFVVWVEP